MERSLNRLLEVLCKLVKKKKICYFIMCIHYLYLFILLLNSTNILLSGETKRRSLSIAFGAMFRRNSGQKEAMLESTNNGYRYEYTL